jgi:hypothetical protein
MLRRSRNFQSPVAVEDDPWDAFLVDDEERDPLPEPGDFWPDEDAEELTFIDGYLTELLRGRMRREVPCCH